MSITKREHHVPRNSEGPSVGDLFDVLVSDRLRGLMGGEGLFERAFDGGSRLMRIEEYTDDGETVIRAELPGIDPEKDVDVSVEDGMLRIRASREERSEEERPDGYHSEFRYGTLLRGLRLPDGISEDDVRATYKDGILEVRVPTPSEPEVKAPRKIAVNRA